VVNATATQVTIQLKGRTETADYRPGSTILQMGRQMGMSPPSQCEAGNCATCMAKLVEGDVTMLVNDALTPDEVEEGWILTCQSIPTTPTVQVDYDF
jgi:ferredoxin